MLPYSKISTLWLSAIQVRNAAYQMCQELGPQFETTHPGDSWFNKICGCRSTVSSILEDIHWQVIQESQQHARVSMQNLKSCSKDTKAKVYYSMVRSNLEHCSSLWNPHHKEQIRKLEMIQRKAALYTINRFRNTTSISYMLEHLQCEESCTVYHKSFQKHH